METKYYLRVIFELTSESQGNFLIEVRHKYNTVNEETADVNKHQ